MLVALLVVYIGAMAIFGVYLGALVGFVLTIYLGILERKPRS